MCWYVSPLTYNDALTLCRGTTTSFDSSFIAVAEAEAATAWGETPGRLAIAVSDATPAVTCKGGAIALNGSPSQSYGASPAVWDHTVLPAIQHR